MVDGEGGRGQVEEAEGSHMSPLGVLTLTLPSPQLLPLNLSYKKPQQLNVLSNTMLKTSSIKNLNLSSNEVRSSIQMFL